jgi:enterochelin esterase-like enzyme
VKGKGTLRIERFASKVLKSNPLHDPYVRELYVYLPPSYGRSRARYPVVYCLAGLTASAQSWFNFHAWVPRMDQRIDRLISDGMPELIAVFPDCFTRYGGSQYLDSPAVGSYRSYLVDEIIPYVDRRFRTKSDATFRGVMGKSSGGYAAITLAMDRPHVFSAVACHSGDMYFDYAYLPDFPIAVRALEKAGGLQKYLKRFDEMPKTGKEDHALLNVIAMSACYSPNQKVLPHLFDLPFEEQTGRIKLRVWRKWKDHDPVEMVHRKGENLKKLGLLFLDCGKRDEFFLNLGARIFVSELNHQNIGHEYEEFEGGHSQTQHRYNKSLMKIANYFSGK